MSTASVIVAMQLILPGLFDFLFDIILLALIALAMRLEKSN